MWRRWYQQLTDQLSSQLGIDAAYYAKSNLALYFGYAVDMVRGIILAAILARLLTPAVYGEYRFVLSFLPIFSYFALPAAAEGIIQAMARGEDRTFRKIYILAWKWAAFSLLASLAVAGWYFWRGQNTLAWVFVLLAPLMPGYGVSGLFTSFYLGQQKFRSLLRANITISLVVLVGMVAAIWWRREVWWLVLVFVVLQLVSKTIFDTRAFAAAKTGAINQQSIIYAKKVSWLQMLLVIRSNFDKILLGSTAGFVPLAVYNVAAVIPDQLKTLVGVTMQSVVARFVKREDKTLVGVIDEKMKKITVIVLLLLIGVLGLTPFVLPLVFSATYQVAVVPALLMILSTIPISLAQPYLTALQAKLQTRKLYWIHGSFAVVELILQIVLIPWFGISGAVAMKIISRLFFASMVMIISHRP